MYIEVPSDAQILDALREHIHHESLYEAMEHALYSETDAYPNVEACLDRLATLFLARNVPIDDMLVQDFILIGANMAQWFQEHFITPMLEVEKAVVEQILEDEAEGI